MKSPFFNTNKVRSSMSLALSCLPFLLLQHTHRHAHIPLPRSLLKNPHSRTNEKRNVSYGSTFVLVDKKKFNKWRHVKTSQIGHLDSWSGQTWPTRFASLSFSCRIYPVYTFLFPSFLLKTQTHIHRLSIQFAQTYSNLFGHLFALLSSYFLLLAHITHPPSFVSLYSSGLIQLHLFDPPL